MVAPIKTLANITNANPIVTRFSPKSLFSPMMAYSVRAKSVNIGQPLTLAGVA